MAATLTRASMRPRPLDRGEPPHHAPGHLVVEASMRPPPLDRGERDGQSILPAQPALASMRPRPLDRGERCFRSAACPPGPCFNAATASRPWRTSLLALTTSALGTLQCGHGLSTVENNDSRARSTRADQLQCGHGLSTVENENAAPARKPAPPASMRPTALHRGERHPRAPAE